MEYRIEKDTMGSVKVPISSTWGAQTQRSLENFQIGIEKMPNEIEAVCKEIYPFNTWSGNKWMENYVRARKAYDLR